LDLAPDELQNVHGEAKKSTWDQMMELFLIPCNPNPSDSRLSEDEKPDTQVVAREQPEEGDLLDYVFENVESKVCRGDAETENETNGNEVSGGAIHSLRRNHSLMDEEDAESHMSTDGNSQKPGNGDLFYSWRTGEIVHSSKHDESERTTKSREVVVDKQKGEPDILDYVFETSESFVCGESITPEEMIMDPDEDDGIIGACSFRDQDPEPPTIRTKEPVRDTKEGNPDALDYVFQNTESFVCGESITPEEMIADPDEEDGIIGVCSLRDEDPEPPMYAKVPEPPMQTKEIVEIAKVEDEQKNKEEDSDVLDYVFETTESFVCGEPIRPQDKKFNALAACISVCY
jgi:hypothetical protein